MILLRQVSLASAFDRRVGSSISKCYCNSMRKTQTSYRARHILLEEFDDAEYVLEKLSAGESFEHLARELSECDTAKNGGDLGIFYTGDMLPEFERALYKMKVGEISRPVKTKYGYHIIEKLEV